MINFNVYALAGDGCMMEGVSGEAASLAGHLKLSNLCWIYDNNHITIEGNTSLAFSEDVATRFLGYGWNVLRVGDANDQEMLARAIRTFQATEDRPTIIIVDSHIAYGAPHKQDTSAAHGEPLGEEEIRLTKRNYGWPEDAKFLVPDGVYDRFQGTAGPARPRRARRLDGEIRGVRQAVSGTGRAIWTRCRSASCRRAGMRTFRCSPPIPKAWPGATHPAKWKTPSRNSLPWLIGGAADLAPSTKTRLTFDGAGDLEAANYGGRNLHFGIREHAMGSILNGLSLSKLRPFGSGFLIFSDYMRAPIRLSALMEIPVIYIFTHDSIGVGEDGPTHQPVEQLISLRAIPGLIVLRPGDANEVAQAWRVIVQLRHEPVCLILSRQNMPTLDRTKYASASGVARGAYILADAAGRQTGRDSDRHGQRGFAVRGCVRKADARGNQGARGQHAVVGAVRAAILRLSEQGAASRRARACLGGAGLGVWLGSLRSPPDRHAHLWRFGAAQGTAEKIRLHPGRCSRRRQRRAGEGTIET